MGCRSGGDGFLDQLHLDVGVGVRRERHAVLGTEELHGVAFFDEESHLVGLLVGGEHNAELVYEHVRPLDHGSLELGASIVLVVPASEAEEVVEGDQLAVEAAVVLAGVACELEAGSVGDGDRGGWVSGDLAVVGVELALEDGVEVEVAGAVLADFHGLREGGEFFDVDDVCACHCLASLSVAVVTH